MRGEDVPMVDAMPTLLEVAGIVAVAAGAALLWTWPAALIVIGFGVVAAGISLEVT